MPGNKKRDKELKAQIRREKKEKRNMHIRNEEEHDDCHELNDQLLSLGLSLKIIPGDGNCLFRALGDQLDGNPYEHLRHREDVVKFMLDNRGDFEPFVEDDLSFDEHIRNLSEPGTFGGNDSIVAFARLHDLTVVIHQLNKPLWQVYSEGGNRNKELHISYHNGDHYNSVRRSDDVNGTGAALVNLSRLQPGTATSDRSHGRSRLSEQSSDESDYENSPNPRKLERLHEEVERLTGVHNENVIAKALETHGYDANLAARSVQSINRNKNVDLWSQNGTGSRIIGNDMLNSNESGSSVRQPQKKLTAKQQKELKKRQKRLQKSSGKKSSNNEDNDENFQCSINQLKTLTI